MPFGAVELALVVVIIFVIFLIYRLSSPQVAPPPESGKPQGGADDDGENKEEETEKPKFTILYGSQSGTAETFSEELKEEAEQYGFQARVVELEDYDFEEDLGEEDFPVFLMATYGEGEPTDDAVTFYEWMTENDFEDDKFQKLTYSVFALGNRQYEHFCNVGLNVHKILGKHGGTALMDCGTGDDDGSLDDDFSEWKENFWKKTKAHFGMGDAEGSIEPVKVPFQVEMVYHPNDKAAGESDSKAVYEAAVSKCTSGVAGFRADQKFQAKLMSVPINRELRQDTFEGNTRHVELELPTGVNYQTADNLGVFGHNDFKLTGKLITRLGLHPKTVMSLKSTDPKFKSIFPVQCTIMDALVWYCDHSSVPRPGHLKKLTVYCTDDLDKARLLSWAAGDKKDEYSADKRNWLEVLEECPSLDLPFDVFLHIVPKLSPWPRYYTIASSSKVNPRHVHVTVTVGPTAKPRDRQYRGICSHTILNLSKGSQVSAFIKASSFRLPSADRPVIMVGPGTGVAPFRAFWQEARLLKEQGKPVKDWHLFFGCRYSDKDWIYKDEMQSLSEVGIQTHLAFSRDQKDKVYVQNLMQDEKLAGELWTLIKEKKARIFVCGATGMGRSIKEALTAIAQEQGKLSNDAATAFIKKLMDDGEYIQELWS